MPILNYRENLCIFVRPSVWMHVSPWSNYLYLPQVSELLPRRKSGTIWNIIPRAASLDFSLNNNYCRSINKFNDWCWWWLTKMVIMILLLQLMIIKSAPIGVWEVKLEIMKDWPTNQPTDGHEGSYGSFTSYNCNDYDYINSYFDYYCDNDKNNGNDKNNYF